MKYVQISRSFRRNFHFHEFLHLHVTWSATTIYNFSVKNIHTNVGLVLTLSDNDDDDN